MRLVAITLAILLLPIALDPVASHHNVNDECTNSLTATGRRCLVLAAPSANPVSPTSGSVFLWLGSVDCGADFACYEVGNLQSRNMVTRMGGTVGLLYSDTNGFVGLQRSPKTIGGHGYASDDLLLA